VGEEMPHRLEVIVSSMTERDNYEEEIERQMDKVYKYKDLWDAFDEVDTVDKEWEPGLNNLL
jgi:hypothetical protein